MHLGGADPDGRAPQGFGALIARGEGVRALGVLFPSSLFADRAPAGGFLHSAFIGGVHDPLAVELADEALVDIAMQARSRVLADHPGRDLTPTFQAVVRWPAAIPQYTVGHRARMAAATAALGRAAPGVILAGAHVGGVSVADAATSGYDAIARLEAA